MSTPRKKPIIVETVPDDASLLLAYGRAARALIARLQPLVGKCDELDNLRAVHRRAQLRIDQLDGEEGSGS